GDWPGHLQRQLELLIGEGVVALYSNGAEGDQSPIARENSGNSRWERAERYGCELGVLAFRAWQNTPVQPDVKFAFHREEFDLPPVTHHPKYLETGGKEYGFTEELLKKMLPRLCPRRTASVSLRLGDLLLIGIPGEMAAGLGLNIKKQSAELSGAKY